MASPQASSWIEAQACQAQVQMFELGLGRPPLGIDDRVQGDGVDEQHHMAGGDLGVDIELADALERIRFEHPARGGPLEIECPEEITTKPLVSRNQDDRIRQVFALTSDDPLPAVNADFLAFSVERFCLSRPSSVWHFTQPDAGWPHTAAGARVAATSVAGSETCSTTSRSSG